MLESISGRSRRSAVPAFAGVLIGIVGLTATYAFDLVTFVAVARDASGAAGDRAAPDADRPSLRSIADGFRYVARAAGRARHVPRRLERDGLRDADGALPGDRDARYGDATLVGYLYAAPYAGALAASLASGWIPHVRRQGLAVAIAARLWGVAIAAFGFAETLWLGLVLLAVAGAADNISAVFRATIMLERDAGPACAAALTGIEFMQVASAPTLGNVESGVVASLTSLRFSIVSGGILCVVGTFVVAALFPALAPLRREARQARVTRSAATSSRARCTRSRPS